MFRTIIRVILVLLVILTAVLGITSIQHPIILKWVKGSARHFGSPIHATVYTNGKINDHIKVFYTDKPGNYLIGIKTLDSTSILSFVHVDMHTKTIGKSVRNAAEDQDLIAGHLFLTDEGERFVTYRDEEKDADYDPQLISAKRQLQFKVPFKQFRFESVRIELH